MRYQPVVENPSSANGLREFLRWFRRGRKKMADRARRFRGAWLKSICVADHIVERMSAEPSEPFADFFRYTTKIRNQHFRIARKPHAQLFVLRRDSHGTRIEGTLAPRDATA